MSKQIGIGKATRLARIGEMVSVSINGTTITAKVARNLSSTKVLVLFDGRTYHVYPESQRTILKTQKTVLAKNERRKNVIKAIPSAVIVYYLPSRGVYATPRAGDSESYYVTINGIDNKHIETIPYDSTNTAFVTNLGNGRYRGAIKHGQRIITGRDANGFFTRFYFKYTTVFTEKSIQTYSNNSTIASVREDWQDLRVRAWSRDLIDEDIDTTGIHPCFNTNNSLYRPILDWSNTAGIYTNLAIENQLYFEIGEEVVAWHPGQPGHPEDTLQYRLFIGSYPVSISVAKYGTFQIPEVDDDVKFCQLSIIDPNLTTPYVYPQIHAETSFVIQNISPHVSWS